MDDLPVRLRVYLLLVIAAGPLLAIALMAGSTRGLSTNHLLLAGLLTSAAAVADRFRFHLTHKTNDDVATVAYLAMVFVLPPWTPGALALLAVLAGERLRRHVRRVDGVEIGFNAGQTSLSVIGAAMALDLTRRAVDRIASQPGDLQLLAPAIVASVVLLVLNTGLVAAAAGLHLEISPLRLWAEGLRQSLPVHATMTALAGLAVVLAQDHPLMLPALAVPIFLVHRAVERTAQLREDTHAALASLVEVVELRDPYTAGHSRRVATMARALALRLGLTAEEADTIESAGRVHDLGKVAIDPAVLANPGRLDDDQWAEMRRHPALGADVIARFAAYGDGHRLVRHHHESWDGTGYPDSLAGEATPFGARILAVADTFDALTSDRPYRRGMRVEEALAILTEGAGSQWDPQIVDALVQHLATAPSSEDEPAAVPAITPPTGALLGRWGASWTRRRLRAHLRAG